jgi:hypothetical protein
MLLLTAALLLFIAARMRRPAAVDADFGRLRQIIADQAYPTLTKAGTEADLKRHFDILPAQVGDVLYLAPASFIDVDELLLIRLKDGDDGETIRRAMEKRLAVLKASFENYGTDQYSLLQQAQIYQNEKYVCYAAGHYSRELLQTVLREIER